MTAHFKAFFVVMVVTVFAFWLARSSFTKFMSDVDFKRRRNLWFALTACAFVIPSFWGYMAVSGVLIWRAGKREANPAALYLFLLLVIPPFQQSIPGFGLIAQVFPLDHFRLLCLALLLPAALRLRHFAAEKPHPTALPPWQLPDMLLVAYGLLPILLYLPHVSGTGTVRSLFLVVIDLFIPYYVLSRSCTSKRMVVETVAALALSAVVLMPLALFEMAKGWLMYSSISDHWRIDSGVIGYLLREDRLRAQLTSGQSIILGNFYAIALGLWLYLQGNLTGWRRWLGTAAVLGGLMAAFSRGPWVGAVVCGFVYFAVGPSATTRVLKLIGGSALVVAAVIASPMGDRFIDYLPFIGTVDEGNISYRQLINDRSWQIIQQNPWFGSPYFIFQMEDLRTGQGIIDLLNVYLSIGMAYGMVTVAVFVMFFLTVIAKCFKASKMSTRSDPDAARLGAALIASLLGTLVIIYTVSNYLSVPYLYVALAALMVAYSRLPSTATVKDATVGSAIDPVATYRPFRLRA